EPTGELAPGAAKRLADVHLVEPGGAVLLEVHATHAAVAAAHAARALRAAAAHRDAPPPSSDTPIAVAIRGAAVLWREGLFFEVHEVLEAVWKTAKGDTRQALQGVIQIAVAYHHLSHGNSRGGTTLARRTGVSPSRPTPNPKRSRVAVHTARRRFSAATEASWSRQTSRVTIVRSTSARSASSSARSTGARAASSRERIVAMPPV